MASSDLSPERFAKITCADLGLPSDMELAIAHKIRETLFRLVCSWIEDTRSLEPSKKAEFRASDLKVSLVAQHSAVDMMSNLWKRAKPTSVEDAAAVPQPMLPNNKDTNACVWKSV